MGPFDANPHRGEDDIYQARRLRRSTLVSLRWMAVAGQSAALAIVGFGLGFTLPYLLCVLFIGASALLNIVILSSAPLDRRISSFEVAAQLLFDALQLSALLYLTGGTENPFSLLLLAPVVVAAKTLDKAVFGFMLVTVGVLSFALLLYHLPLPWYGGSQFTLPQTYQYGSWIALMVGMVFTSGYTWRATAQTRRMTDALAVSQTILAHEKKLSALGGLAAAAAHELGTPLATISVVAKEISRSAAQAPAGNTELKEDADLLLSQAQRCRKILKSLSVRGDQGDVVHDHLDLATLLAEITADFDGHGVEIITRLEQGKNQPKAPVLQRQPELFYGLTNIVENAVDFASSQIEVVGSWTDREISIEIRDDGPGFDPSVLSKLGEPYISVRTKDQEKTAGLAAGGLGLGIFIAKTLIMRLGGDVVFSNSKGGGARVYLRWPYKQK